MGIRPWFLSDDFWPSLRCGGGKQGCQSGSQTVGRAEGYLIPSNALNVKKYNKNVSFEALNGYKKDSGYIEEANVSAPILPGVKIKVKALSVLWTCAPMSRSLSLKVPWCKYPCWGLKKLSKLPWSNVRCQGRLFLY